MKRNILLSAVFLFAGPLLAADPNPKDDVTAAAKKLAEESNYSWKNSTEFGNFESSSEGKVEKNGPTFVSMSFGDNTTDMAFQGKKAAAKTPDSGWQTLDELKANSDQQGPGRFLVLLLENFKAPAAEIQDLAAKAKEIKKEAEVYSSDLTEEGAKDLLSFGGRRTGDAGPKNAKGSVKFWIKDGAVTKYELHLQGTVNWGGDDRDVDRTTTVEIKDVGKTKVELPADAKKKLS